MFALDLFNTKYERELQEGALDDTISRTQAHLMEPLSRRAAEIRTQLRAGELRPMQIQQLEREYEDLVDKRMKILKGEITSREECMGYGGLGEAGLPDVADKQAKMAQLNQPNKAGTDLATAQQRVNPNPNKGVVGHAVDWLRGKGGPGQEGPTYEDLDEGQYDIPNQYLYVVEQIRDAYEQGKPYADITMPNNEIVPITRPAMFNLLASLGKMERKQIKKLMVRYFNDKHSLMTLLSSNLIKRFVTPPIPKPVQEPGQGNLPLNDPNKVAMEARGQKKNTEEPDLSGTTARDATVQRELQKVRARHPSARTDIEALVKDEIENQERVDQVLSQQQAELKQQTAQTDQLSRVNQQQDSKINSLQQQLAQAVRNLQQPTTATTATTAPATTTPAKALQPSVTIAPTVSAVAPAEIPEPVTAKDQEIYDKVRDLETELKSKIDAMASWNAIAQKDPESNNELEALRKEVERTRTELGQQVKKLKKQTKKTAKQIAKVPRATAKNMGTVRQVPVVPRLGQTPTDDRELGTQISQRAQANKRTKYSPRRSATQAVPADTAGNQQDLFGQLGNYGIDAEEIRDQSTDYGDMNNLSQKINLRGGKPITVDAEAATAPEEEKSVSENTMDPTDTGAGQQLSRTPEIRRLRQQKDYELMLKKELANRIQDRDESDDEQDFQDVTESNMKRLEDNLAKMSDEEFQTRYGKNKAYWRNRIRANLAPATNTNINDLESDIDTAQTRPSFDRAGRVVRQKPANSQQGMRRMLGQPKATRPAAELNPVEVTMQVPNRKTDRYDLLPARIFNSEAEAREFARRVNGHITGIRPVMHEDSTQNQRLHAGDPIIVTAPNEFEGATGEIYELSPSGKFVIVNLYNHGRHSMHLSDVEFNQYAAADEDEDDWYDDEEVDEGFQDFNRVEPYAVCLAGKPVKKFDYYEEARRFHDNWKKKLYREGDKAKADKITLMPLNLDEEEQKPYNPNEFRPVGPITIVPPKKLKSGETHQGINDYWKAHGQAPIYKTNEAGSPAQQAAIAIAKKKEQGVAEGSGDLKSELASVYSELAPKIKRHRDSFGAGQLYDALEAVADKHGAGKQLAIMMRSARNSAHMEYDTNPGGFENWFWFLPFATDDEQGVAEGELREDAIPAKMVIQGFVVEYDPSTRTVVISKRGQELEKYRYNGQASLLSFQRNVGHRIKALEDDLYGADDEAGAVSLSRVKVPGRGYGYQELDEDDSSTSSDEAESAILKRIMVAHLDLLKEVGPEKVMQAVEEVAYNIGDLDEIGSSDVSGWVHQVRDILGVPEPDQEEFLDEKWSTKYKRSIDCSHPKGFSQRAHCAGRKK
jgi:hypothetical protein